MKLAQAWLILLAAVTYPAAAQVFDNTGNSMLSGTYYFREVVYVLGDDSGDLSDAASYYGTITFSGGNYTISGQLADYSNESVGAQPGSGTYKISASGYGYLTNPLISGQNIYGAVGSGGIFIGSTTESGYNDLFIAAPVSSTPATVATFSGAYSAAYFNPGQVAVSGGIEDAYDALLTFNASGSGTIGSVNITGYLGGNGSSSFTQTESGVKYTASSGAEVVTFPNATNDAVTGQEYFYISPDGNFVFGGSPQGFDMFVGVRNATGGTFGGNYYQAGIELDESNLASGYGLTTTFFGALNASGGNIIGDQRLNEPLVASSGVSFTYGDTYPSGTNGSFTDSNDATQYISGNNGAIVIGFGQGPFLGISVDLAYTVPSATSSVYISPNGVVNSASSAPFTAGVVPGELVTIYGQNLAPSLKVSSAPFLTTLNNVQVLVNGLAAPIYYVSPTQVSVQVPFGLNTTVAQFQVVNGSSTSNAVTEFVYQTSPGIFTEPAGGLGYGAILDASTNYSLVTPENPAQVGDTVAIYATGLGTVFPVIADGTAAPLSSLTNTTNTFTADIGGVTATVNYAGLAPGYAGLYQLNVVIPSGVEQGDNTVDISGPDSYATEALISIGSSGVAANTNVHRNSRATARAVRRTGRAIHDRIVP